MPRVIPIGLISLGRKRFLHMDGLDDDHRQPHFREIFGKPG
jgi:hypothetical protein